MCFFWHGHGPWYLMVNKGFEHWHVRNGFGAQDAPSTPERKKKRLAAATVGPTPRVSRALLMSPELATPEPCCLPCTDAQRCCTFPENYTWMCFCGASQQLANGTPSHIQEAFSSFNIQCLFPMLAQLHEPNYMGLSATGINWWVVGPGCSH